MQVSGQHFGTATTVRPVNLLRIEEQLSEAHLRLSGVTVEHLSLDKCLLKYDRLHSFMYADPSYWKLAGYGMNFGLDQYEKMAELMLSCKSKVMLSINDHTDMWKVFEKLNIDTTEISYSVGNNAKSHDKKNELIITNY